MSPVKNTRKPNHTRLWLVMTAFLFFSSLADAQFSLNVRCMDAYRHILMLQFKDANILLNQEKSENPSNPIPVYLENYIDFLTLFVGENRNQYDQLKNKIPLKIDLLERGNENSPFFLFTMAEVNLQWAFIRIKFGDYTTAVMEIRKAYQLFIENQKKFPDFLPNKLGLGIIHILAGSIPENYRWIARIAGINGSIENGMAEVRQVAEYSGTDKTFRIYRPEALFYLAIVSVNLSKDRKTSLDVINMLEGSFNKDSLSTSSLFVFIRVNLLMKNGQSDEAGKILEKRITDKNAYPFYYLDYLEGIIRLNRLDLTSGIFFQKYLTEFKGINYIKAAYQKLAWIGLLKGDTSAFILYNRMVLHSGNAIIDEDKQAENQAEQKLIPNLVLLRARLLFDGGHYKTALNELTGNSLKVCIKSKRDLIEYSYRLGRIYQETGNETKALQNYYQTIEKGKNEPYYYAAAAAFQLGIIYENLGQYKKADSAYHLCISIHTPEYKTSLNQKAKAGLNRLKRFKY